MQAKQYPSLQELHDLFIYDQGELYNKTTRSYLAKKGQIAGTINKKGYSYINLKGKLYLKHRIIWIMHNGALNSTDVIDHNNQNILDNRIENLRLANKSQNGQNTYVSKRNTSGHKGVSWAKTVQKWVAYINLNRKRHILGYFDDINDAVAARKKAEQELGWNQF